MKTVPVRLNKSELKYLLQLIANDQECMLTDAPRYRYSRSTEKKFEGAIKSIKLVEYLNRIQH